MIGTMMRRLAGAAAATMMTLALPAAAQDLTIGLGASVTSIDPHFHALNPNNQVARHIFDRLMHNDAQQRLIPGTRHGVEGDRRDDVGVQAAQGRQVP